MLQSEVAVKANISKQAVHFLKKNGLTAQEIMSKRKTGRPSNPLIIIDGQRWCNIAMYAKDHSVKVSRINYFIRIGKIESINILNVRYIKDSSTIPQRVFHDNVETQPKPRSFIWHGLRFINFSDVLKKEQAKKNQYLFYLKKIGKINSLITINNTKYLIMLGNTIWNI